MFAFIRRLFGLPVRSVGFDLAVVGSVALCSVWALVGRVPVFKLGRSGAGW